LPLPHKRRAEEVRLVSGYVAAMAFLLLCALAGAFAAREDKAVPLSHEQECAGAADMIAREPDPVMQRYYVRHLYPDCKFTEQTK
jgi:hypothetical protein